MLKEFYPDKSRDEVLSLLCIVILHQILILKACSGHSQIRETVSISDQDLSQSFHSLP